MKVYVVTRGYNYEGFVICMITASKEKAEEEKLKLEKSIKDKTDYADYAEIEEHELI